MHVLDSRFRSLALLFCVLIPFPLGAQAPAQQPLSLAELLERVRTQHPRIGAADSRVAAALGARRAAGVFPNPVLGLGVENATLPGNSPGVMDRETMTTATIPLEFLYQRGSRVRRGDAELAASRADGFAERQRLALDATRAYYRVAVAQVEVATALDLAAWLDSLVAYNRARASEGVAAEADLLRTELEREHAYNDLTLQRSELARARGELSAFSADSGAPTPRVLVALPDAPLELSPPGETTLPGPRPEVLSARARLSAGAAGVGVARSMLVRDVSAMAGLKWSAGTTTLLAGLSLPVPLLDQNRGELSRARAERAVATFELAAIERQASAELTGAVEGAALLAERIHALTGRSTTAPSSAQPRYLAQADEARRIAFGAYQEGAVPLLQVLDAARAWGEARRSYYRTLYAQHESVVALLVAQGRDLFTTIPALLQSAPESGSRKGAQ